MCVCVCVCVCVGVCVCICIYTWAAHAPLILLPTTVVHPCEYLFYLLDAFVMGWCCFSTFFVVCFITCMPGRFVTAPFQIIVAGNVFGIRARTATALRDLERTWVAPLEMPTSTYDSVQTSFKKHMLVSRSITISCEWAFRIFRKSMSTFVF